MEETHTEREYMMRRRACVTHARQFPVREGPMTLEAMKRQAEFLSGDVSGVVKVDVDNVIDGDYESFLDLLSMALTGSDLLMDITWYAIGVDDTGLNLICQVTGDPSEIINMEEGE